MTEELHGSEILAVPGAQPTEDLARWRLLPRSVISDSFCCKEPGSFPAAAIGRPLNCNTSEALGLRAKLQALAQMPTSPEHVDATAGVVFSAVHPLL